MRACVTTARQDADLVALVDALDPGEAEAKSVLVLQATGRTLVHVHVSMRHTVDVHNLLPNGHDGVGDSGVAQHKVLALVTGGKQGLE